MAKNFEIDLELRAKDLGLSLEKVSIGIQKEFNEAVKNVAHGAYAKLTAGAQKKLNSTRLDYLRALSMRQTAPNTYVIELNGDFANRLEEGMPAFDMKPGMLASSKTVSAGTRAGKPWVQTAKDGHKFAHVPFEHRPFSKAPRNQDLNQILRGTKVLNHQGLKQKITSVFKDAAGKPLEGMVARINHPGVVANLQGLTKYQKVTKTSKGKDKVHSLYLTWRTVSENSSGWQHPGTAGLRLFEQAEHWVQAEVDNIIKAFTGRA